MTLLRYATILLLTAGLAACGSDAIFGPSDDPRPGVVPAPSGSGGDDAGPSDDHCDGVWVTVENPDGTTTRTCKSPYVGTGN